MIRRPPRSTQSRSSAASDVYKRQALWSIVASAIGYLFANIVYIFVHDIKKYEMFLVPAVTVIVVMLIFVYRHIVKEKEKTYGNQ